MGCLKVVLYPLYSMLWVVFVSFSVAVFPSPSLTNSTFPEIHFVGVPPPWVLWFQGEGIPRSPSSKDEDDIFVSLDCCDHPFIRYGQ